MDNNHHQSEPNQPGGKGGDAVVLGTTTSDTRMIEKAIKQGWDIPQEAFERLPQQMLNIAENAESDRNRIAATRAIVAMHGQNQDMQPKEMNHHHEVKIIHDEEWYGNDAHDHAAQAVAASGASAALPSPVQNGGVRPAVGQNGNGSANGHKGTRGAEGSTNGSD